ncbi:MAG: HEPN domain-containing protein [Thermoleophilia bacterium]|nr:HEPN domain-containing protein [Thermoleophilia bacterium]
MKDVIYLPPEAQTAADWLALAKRELAFLESITPAFPDMVLLHAQQVIEKSLKSVIWSLGEQPPFTHSIDTLVERLPLDMPAPSEIQNVMWLSEMCIVTRYYADEPAATDDQVSQARRAASASVTWAGSIIGA